MKGVFQSFVETEPPDWEHFNEIFMECLSLNHWFFILKHPCSSWTVHQNEQAAKNYVIRYIHAEFPTVVSCSLSLGTGYGNQQCWKFPQVRQSEADKFGGGLATFCWFFLNFMFMIWNSRLKDLQLFDWVSNTGNQKFYRCLFTGKINPKCLFSQNSKILVFVLMHY